MSPPRVTYTAYIRVSLIPAQQRRAEQTPRGRAWRARREGEKGTHDACVERTGTESNVERRDRDEIDDVHVVGDEDPVLRAPKKQNAQKGVSCLEGVP